MLSWDSFPSDTLDSRVPVCPQSDTSGTPGLFLQSKYKIRITLLSPPMTVSPIILDELLKIISVTSTIYPWNYPFILIFVFINFSQKSWSLLFTTQPVSLINSSTSPHQPDFYIKSLSLPTDSERLPNVQFFTPKFLPRIPNGLLDLRISTVNDSTPMTPCFSEQTLTPGFCTVLKTNTVNVNNK